MILIYAFSNRWGTNISRRTLTELQKIFSSKSPLLKGDFEGLGLGGDLDINFIPIFYQPQEFFRKHINNYKYDLIIGLGDYYGSLTKIKIETQAKNVYNDKEIYPFSPILLDLNLPNIDNLDSSCFQISSNMGTYNCNWIAYKTQLYLNQKNLLSKHLFLHLPPKSNATHLATNILNLLKSNNLLNFPLSSKGD